MKISLIQHNCTNNAPSKQYQASIDGIRSIAVLSVFLFHLNRNILPGGFIGVDVFFAISGFLITRLLVINLGRRDYFIEFYQRRIARIFPAMITVIVLVSVAGYFIFSAQSLFFLGGNIVAAAFSVINIKLLFKNDYFKMSQDAEPLLHYWSLAVEEQFYLIFPAIIFISSRLFKTLILPVGLLFLGSFVTCLIWTACEPTSAFYVLPTRAWELLAGSLLAICEIHGISFMSARAARGAAAFGAALLLVSIIFIKESNNFPGALATLPVISSILLLASADNAGFINRGLSHYIPVFIGRRSYSLYLLHWPIFSFVDYQYFMDSEIIRAVMKVVLSTGLTLVSYQLLELPARRALNKESNRRLVFMLFFVITAAVAIIGYRMHLKYYYDVKSGQIATGGIEVNSGGRGSVVLMGDSLAGMYGGVLASLAQSQGFKLNVLSAAGHNELPGETLSVWPHVENFLLKHRPNVIVVGELWSWKFGGDTKALKLALSGLPKLADHVILLLQPPYAPERELRELIRDRVGPSFFEQSRDLEYRLNAERSIRAAAPAGMEVLDIAPALINSDGSIRVISSDGRVTFEDNQHLSDSGAKLVRPMLDQALKHVFIKLRADAVNGASSRSPEMSGARQ